MKLTWTCGTSATASGSHYIAITRCPSPENSDDADISRRNNICGMDAAFKGCFQMALSMPSGSAFRWVVDACFPMVLWML
jgi:hypothetical protein